MGKSKYQYGEKVGTKPSRNNPCTNGLVHYSVQECKQVVWSYNLEAPTEVKNTKFLVILLLLKQKLLLCKSKNH